MFREAKVAWDYLLLASVSLVFGNSTELQKASWFLMNRPAALKADQRIHKAHKQKHKASGGYVNGQTVVLLLLVTQSVTFPVGFAFICPILR